MRTHTQELLGPNQQASTLLSLSSSHCCHAPPPPKPVCAPRTPPDVRVHAVFVLRVRAVDGRPLQRNNRSGAVEEGRPGGLLKETGPRFCHPSNHARFPSSSSSFLSGTMALCHHFLPPNLSSHAARLHDFCSSRRRRLSLDSGRPV